MDSCKSIINKGGEEMKARFLFVILAMVGFFTGCAAIPTAPNPVEITTRYGLMRYLAKSDARQAEAQRMIDHMREYADKTDQISINLLITEAKSELGWEKLNPADRYFLEEMFMSFVPQLSDQVGEGIIDPDNLIYVHELLGWFQQTVDMTRILS